MATIRSGNGFTGALLRSGQYERGSITQGVCAVDFRELAFSSQSAIELQDAREAVSNLLL